VQNYTSVTMSLRLLQVFLALHHFSVLQRLSGAETNQQRLLEQRKSEVGRCNIVNSGKDLSWDKRHMPITMTRIIKIKVIGQFKR